MKDLFSVLIMALAGFGTLVNLSSVCILARKKMFSMFHNLLKMLALYDLVVVLGCAMLYSFPNLWPFYKGKLQSVKMCLSTKMSDL